MLTMFVAVAAAASASAVALLYNPPLMFFPIQTPPGRSQWNCQNLSPLIDITKL